MATLETITDILTEFEATGEPIYRLLKRKSVPVNVFYRAVKDNAELTERYETARKMWSDIRRDTQRETLERKLFDLAHGKAKETKIKTVKHQKDTDGNLTTIETTETTKAPDAKALIFMLTKLDPFYSAENGGDENVIVSFERFEV